MKSRLLFLTVLAGSAALYAQSNPLTSALKQNYNGVKNNILKAAEKMSDADYSFKAGQGSRSFGEIVTHIAQVQGALCAGAKGETKQFDVSKTDKASAVAVLKETTDYCDAVYEPLTDASAMEMGKMFGRDQPKFNILNFNVIHDNEMYGQMAVYLRAKGMVPPSSEGRGPMRGR
jgi:uncharacterized damage-inducible protein DinB